MHERLRLLETSLIASLVLLGTVTAFASDGVIELNQSCATSTGCLSGDTPGFPITIDSGGAYILTSDLSLAEDDTGVWVQTDNVDLNLNGFGILGLPANIGESPIRFDSGNQGLSVHDGRIDVDGPGPTFGLAGADVRLTNIDLAVNQFSCGDRCSLQNVKGIFRYDVSGALVTCGEDCSIRDSLVRPEITSSGISLRTGASCGARCVVSSSSFFAGGDGASLVTGVGSVVTDSILYSSASLGSGSVIKGSKLTATEGDEALVTSSNCLVHSTSLSGRANAGNGTSFVDSSISYLGGGSGFPAIFTLPGNVVSIKGTRFIGSMISFGPGTVIDAGGNVCNGSLGCP